MLRSFSFLVLCVAIALPALAQATGSIGNPVTPAAKKLDVAASSPRVRPPRFGDDDFRFRFTFRVLTSGEENIAFTAMRSGGPLQVLDWTAFTSEGARCHVRTDDMTGVKAFAGNAYGLDSAFEELRTLQTTGTVADKVRPSIVSADFSCDDQLIAGDTVTVQIKLFIRSGRNWEEASYTFQNLALEAR